jgi:hypothetical protein
MIGPERFRQIINAIKDLLIFFSEFFTGITATDRIHHPAEKD